MSGGGGKAGSTSNTSTVEVPQWLEDAARANMDRAQDISQIGYVPHYGPDVAGLTPMQMAAMQNTGQAASAFGLPGGGMTGSEGMPAPTNYGGMSAYSSAPIFNQSLAALRQNAPGQAQAIANQFIDPMTGAMPQSAYGVQPQQMMVAQGGMPRYERDKTGQPYYLREGGAGAGPMPAAGPYQSVGDMLNGGGPGAAGNQFQGFGPVSGAANMIGTPGAYTGLRDMVDGGGGGGKKG